MAWLFANATRRVYRCADGTVALAWIDVRTFGERFECLEHGVGSCAHVREMRSALPPDAGVPSRADPRMFERAPRVVLRSAEASAPRGP